MSSRLIYFVACIRTPLLLIVYVNIYHILFTIHLLINPWVVSTFWLL
jgi:hypothetical protein